MEEVQVCSSWEEIEENSNLLDQQLERLKLEKCQQTSGGDIDGVKIKILKRINADTNSKAEFSPTQIALDTTREENLRSQYVPPEPKIKLLARPKNNTQKGNQSSKSKTQPTKTLEQREKEYMEARKRILGDVTFEDDEEVTGGSESDGSGLSPAEILKQKVAQAMKQEDDLEVVSDEGKNESGSGSGGDTAVPKSKSKRGKRREKLKTSNPESPRDFPLSKSESERILRQPRGPDGTMGFAPR